MVQLVRKKIYVVVINKDIFSALVKQAIFLPVRVFPGSGITVQSNLCTQGPNQGTLKSGRCRQGVIVTFAIKSFNLN